MMTDIQYLMIHRIINNMIQQKNILILDKNISKINSILKMDNILITEIFKLFGKVISPYQLKIISINDKYIL